MLHSGLASFGGLVGGVWGGDSGDAIDWCLLDSALRDFRGARFRSIPGERTAHQESAGAQKRRTREPMVTKATHLRITEQLLPTHIGNPCGADLLAAAGRACARGVKVHPEDAQNLDPDERAVSQRDQ